MKINEATWLEDYWEKLNFYINIHELILRHSRIHYFAHQKPTQWNNLKGKRTIISVDTNAVFTNPFLHLFIYLFAVNISCVTVGIPNTWAAIAWFFFFFIFFDSKSIALIFFFCAAYKGRPQRRTEPFRKRKRLPWVPKSQGPPKMLVMYEMRVSRLTSGCYGLHCYHDNHGFIC